MYEKNRILQVLIADFDLYQSVGGGQTTYRRLIETYNEIEFYYLVKDEKVKREDPKRPLNAHPIHYKNVYDLEILYSASLTEDLPPRWTCREFVEASNIAASLSGLEFDIVEVPDYKQFGLFLRSAFLHHQVKCKSFVLSLHGSISTSLRLNWGTDSDEPCIQLEELERLQYSCMDIRYGISKKYIYEWIGRTGIEPLYLHPMRFLIQPKPQVSPTSNRAPSLNFVGRTEKRKGPDIFIEIAWWLSHEGYSEANIIGPSSSLDGIESTDFIQDYLKNRTFEVNIHPSSTHKELSKLYASKAIVILPSRYDTLNLVALESLLAGCPTAIGSGAAVCEFLEENYPEVPFVKIDMDNWYGCLPEIKEILNNYDEYRYSLVEALKKSEPNIHGFTLPEIYRAEPVNDPAAIEQLHQWYQMLMNFCKSPASVGLLTQIHILSVELRNRLNSRVLTGPVKRAILENVLVPMFAQDKTLLHQAFASRCLANEYINIYFGREITEKQIEQKLKSLRRLDQELRLDRGRRWAEIARLERLRNNTEIAAAYDLRAMRLCDGDKLNRLPQVINDLKQCGYAREAEVAQAMFAARNERFSSCRTIIEENTENHRQYQSGDFEFIDDRRSSQSAHVSVVVSLYKAADKLRHFLQTLSNQTLFRNEQAELIFIETDSPSGDYEVFREAIQATGLSKAVVYARTATRETIQSAWNRGITLTRAPYLAFLGVDEGLVPDALEILAQELDGDHALDWIMSSSLITEVDSRGSWKRDIMAYDRDGYKQHLVNLETCYLSWVGGLYRKSIHERFGYYDASFGAAGDTEFKSRVLPFLKSRVIPRTLGIFWNYPDDRATESPRAEIEDLRAWYLYRTEAGVVHALQRYSQAEIEAILLDCFSYRKSYCQHQSSDIEYALQIINYLKRYHPESSTLRYAPGVEAMAAGLRELDWLHKAGGWRAFWKVGSFLRLARKIQGEHARLSNGLVKPSTFLLNDNRYEQHCRSWESIKKSRRNVPGILEKPSEIETSLSIARR